MLLRAAKKKLNTGTTSLINKVSNDKLPLLNQFLPNELAAARLKFP